MSARVKYHIILLKNYQITLFEGNKEKMSYNMGRVQCNGTNDPQHLHPKKRKTSASCLLSSVTTCYSAF